MSSVMGDLGGWSWSNHGFGCGRCSASRTTVREGTIPMPLCSPVAALGRARLRTRLMLTYAFVLVINVVTVALTVRSLAPIGPGAPKVISTPEAMLQFRTELDEGLVGSVIMGIALSLGTGAMATILISRLIMRPVEQMRGAARHMALGHYDTRVPAPGPPELAGIADDLNLLSSRL